MLLLDEPLSALDYKLRKEMQIELKRLQHETGITFIFVTHDQEEALTMSDRIAVMSAGRILQVGTPRDIYDRPADRFVADFIGETNFLEGRIAGIANGIAAVTLRLRRDASAPSAGRLRARTARPPSSCAPSMRASCAAGERSALSGTLDNIVYFGTDTHFHVRLDGRRDFIVRQQNRRRRRLRFARGDEVGILRSTTRRAGPQGLRMARAEDASRALSPARYPQSLAALRAGSDHHLPRRHRAAADRLSSIPS